jgi:hypothetical protein
MYIEKRRLSNTKARKDKNGVVGGWTFPDHKRKGKQVRLGRLAQEEGRQTT